MVFYAESQRESEREREGEREREREKERERERELQSTYVTLHIIDQHLKVTSRTKVMGRVVAVASAMQVKNALGSKRVSCFVLFSTVFRSRSCR